MLFKDILKRGMNKGAYRGKLNCPFCASPKQSFVENVGHFRKRYRCKQCKNTYQYDFSNNPDAHPYAPLKKPSFQEILSISKTRKT